MASEKPATGASCYSSRARWGTLGNTRAGDRSRGPVTRSGRVRPGAPTARLQRITGVEDLGPTSREDLGPSDGTAGNKGLRARRDPENRALGPNGIPGDFEGSACGLAPLRARSVKAFCVNHCTARCAVKPLGIQGFAGVDRRCTDPLRTPCRACVTASAKSENSRALGCPGLANRPRWGCVEMRRARGARGRIGVSSKCVEPARTP